MTATLLHLKRKKHIIEVRNSAYRANGENQIQVPLLQSQGPRTSYLTSLHLTVLTHKMRTIIAYTLWDCYEDTLISIHKRVPLNSACNTVIVVI